MDVSPFPPTWIQDAVFYQIFPDRFRNGDPGNDPPNVHPWGSPPTPRTFFGGDLAGVIEKFDYLLDLGVNALYFNPIFISSSTHRYNTYDYFRIDPRLGDLGTFRRLLRLAHRNGVRVILDGVFNHCGRGFFPFHDLLENGPDSPYRDWFYIQGFPLHAYEETLPPNYLCWWNLRSLPKLNVSNPEVRRLIFSVARYWLKQGADGWRLDVPNEIDDDAFWREFRQVVKKTSPEAYIVGEIWTDGRRWLQGDQFDGITNYELRTVLLEWLVEGRYRALALAHRLQALLSKYRPETVRAQLNVLGSHDTPRLLTVARGDLTTVKLLWLLVMTWPGAPCIYYGDEIGMTGGPDPDCRRCFPWDEREWNHELRDYIRRLIAWRKALPALRRGETHILLAHPRQNLYAHGRGKGNEAAVMALNACDAPRTFDIPLEGMEVPAGLVLVDLFGGRRYPVRNGRLEAVSLPPRSGTLLVGEEFLPRLRLLPVVV
ncbi:MAG: glycoside hydrolase family 13 protein [Chloroflexia bacterium]